MPRLLPPAALLLLAACGPESPTLAADAPDVLLITFDALPSERAGFLGAQDSATPALDAFAAGARVLERATAPWSLPALASWMSGAPVEAHRCDDPAGVLDPRFVSLAERLLAAGYETACIVSELAATSRHGLAQGFVHVDEALAFPEVDPALARPAQALADRAIRFVDQRAGSAAPWLLWLHATVPPDEDGLRATDAHVARLLERVRERADAAVVVIASATRDAAGAPAPLLLAAPGLAPGRATLDARPIDLLPTVVELAGLAPPRDLPGRSLVR